MNRGNEGNSGKKGAGIRLSRLNIVMICIGLVIATLLAASMYRTTVSVRGVVTFTENYLTSQQAGGMLRDFAGELGELAISFVQSGEVGPAKAYEAKMNVINAQLELYAPETSASAAVSISRIGAALYPIAASVRVNTR